MTAPVLELAGIAKSYGAVRAVAALDLRLNAGEVLALVGENGAGKSTVVNMISGMTQPDGGSILMHGREVTLASARQARAHGIGVVHQHYALVPSFTVAETFALGVASAGLLDRAALGERVRALADEIGIVVDPDARIGSLDVAGQQRVEILKALSRPVDVLILDEPSAVLTPEDADRLFSVVAGLRDRGVAVLLITHKISDVFRVCDRAAVMHAGKLVCDRPVSELSPAAIISLMIVGREGADEAADMASRVSGDFVASIEVPVAEGGTVGAAPAGSPLFSVNDVALRRSNGSLAVSGLSFDLREGEILAIAGVDGNGQSELVRCMAGLSVPAEGHMEFAALDSRRPAEWTVARLRGAGLAHVPDDRRRIGIADELSLTENLMLSHLVRHRFRRGPLLDRRRARSDTGQAIQDYAIRTTGPDQPIGRLSGGNQQKLVLARELLDAPRVLLAAHPSRGLDIRTIAGIHERLRKVREAGAAVLLVSADLGEIWQLADRMIVLAAGQAFGPVPPGETSLAEVGAWMAGHVA